MKQSRVIQPVMQLSQLSLSLRPAAYEEYLLYRWDMDHGDYREIIEASLFASYIYNRTDDNDSFVTVQELLAYRGIILDDKEIERLHKEVYLTTADYNAPIVIGWIGRTSIFSCIGRQDNEQSKRE